MARKSAPSLASLAPYGRRVSNTAPGNSFHRQTTLGPIQSAILGLLATTRNGRMSQADIRIFLQTRSLSNVTMAAHSLVRRGLVTRTVGPRNGSNGGGGVTLALTAAARTLLGSGLDGGAGVVLCNAPQRR